MHTKPVLEYSVSYQKASEETKAEICNGMGAAFFPSWLTSVLNNPVMCLGVSLKPAADIHDWDYSLGKTAIDRRAADKRFGNNMLTLIQFYSFMGRIPVLRLLNPLYLIRRWITKKCYLVVRLGGWSAFYGEKVT